MDHTGTKVLGTHPTKAQAVAQLQAIEINKHKFADGGVKETSPEDYKRLIEQYKNVPKASKTMFNPAEAAQLTQKVGEAQNLDQKGKLLVLDYLRNKLSNNPVQGSNLDVNLDNFLANVRGSNPPQDVPVIVPGNGQPINDISRVSGKIPVDQSKVVVPSGAQSSAPITYKMQGVTEKINTRPLPMVSKSGEEFVGDVAAKIAAKKAAAQSIKQGIKSAGKKLLGAVPLVGGVAQALSTGDAFAALPGVGDVLESEEVGRGSDVVQGSSMDRPTEQGQMTPERFRRLTDLINRRR